MFDNRITKEIWKEVSRGKSAAEKPRKGWPGEVWKDTSKLLNTENMRAAGQHRSERRRKTEETMASERAREPEEYECDIVLCLFWEHTYYGKEIWMNSDRRHLKVPVKIEEERVHNF